MGVRDQGCLREGVEGAALSVAAVVDGEDVEAAPLEDLVELAAVALADGLGVAVQVQDHGGAGGHRDFGPFQGCRGKTYRVGLVG